MKRYIPFSGYFTTVILLLASLVSGCIKDNRDDCETSSYRLIVKTIESDSVNDSDIGDVVLFVFDKEQKFIGIVDTRINQVTELPYSSYNELYVIAWGNINGPNQSLSDPIANQHPEEIDLTLKMKNNPYSFSPNDLFQGAKPITLQSLGNAPEVLLINRIISGVSIIAQGLQQYLNTLDEDFTYVIRGTNKTVNLDGSQIESEAYLQPIAAFDNNQEFRTFPFNVFPSDHIIVDIYKADQLVYTVDQDNAGNPFVAPAGKKLSIIINFSGNIQVSVSINDWSQTTVTDEL